MDSLMARPRTCTREQLVRRHAVEEPLQLNQPDSSRSLPLDEGLAPRTRPRIGRPPDADVVAVVVIVCFMLVNVRPMSSLVLVCCYWCVSRVGTTVVPWRYWQSTNQPNFSVKTLYFFFGVMGIWVLVNSHLETFAQVFFQVFVKNKWCWVRLSQNIWFWCFGFLALVFSLWSLRWSFFLKLIFGC